MVSLKSRSNKSFKATVVLDGVEHSVEYPTLSLDERASLARLSDDKKLKFIVAKYARAVDPELSDEEIEYLDDEVVAAIMKPVNDRYSDANE